MEQSEILIRLRKEKGLSQAEVAEELGVTRQAVSRWEAGRAWPSAENLVALSRVYGMTVEEMMQGRREGTEAVEPSVEEGGQEETESNQQAEQARGRVYKRRWGMILAAGLFSGVLLYGKLTNSMLLAGGLLVLVISLAGAVCLLYGLFTVIMHFRKDG